MGRQVLGTVEIKNIFKLDAQYMIQTHLLLLRLCAHNLGAVHEHANSRVPKC